MIRKSFWATGISSAMDKAVEDMDRRTGMVHVALETDDSNFGGLSRIMTI